MLESALSELLLAICLEGSDVVMAIHAFFDESYGDIDTILVVAGYLFRKSKLRQFERDWRNMLRVNGLPFFRMSSCAHGNGPFAGMHRDRRIAIEKGAIALIKKYCILGWGVVVPDRNISMPENDLIKSVYESCVLMLMVGVTEQVKHLPGSIGYFFEAGHADSGKAGVLMQKLVTDPAEKDRYRCSGFGFVEKVASPGAQAADLLAWQLYTEAKSPSDKKRRKDFHSLLGVMHAVICPFDPAESILRAQYVTDVNAAK